MREYFSTPFEIETTAKWPRPMLLPCSVIPSEAELEKWRELFQRASQDAKKLRLDLEWYTSGSIGA